MCVRLLFHPDLSKISSTMRDQAQSGQYLIVLDQDMTKWYQKENPAESVPLGTMRLKGVTVMTNDPIYVGSHG